MVRGVYRVSDLRVSILVFKAILDTANPSSY